MKLIKLILLSLFLTACASTQPKIVNVPVYQDCPAPIIPAQPPALSKNATPAQFVKWCIMQYEFGNRCVTQLKGYEHAD